MDKLGPVLVVWKVQTEQGASLLGAHHLEETGSLWKEERRASGSGNGGEQRQTPRWRSRKDFGHHARQATARPSNMTVRDLLSDGRCTKTVLGFLKARRVGKIKKGVLDRGWSVYRLLFSFCFSLFFFVSFRVVGPGTP